MILASCAETGGVKESEKATLTGSDTSYSVGSENVANNATQRRYRKLELVRGTLDSRVRQVDEMVADHALRIASYLLSSKEFQDSIFKLEFNYHNLCDECDTNIVEGQPNITGDRVLDSIFRDQRVSLNLLLKKVGKPPIFGKCFGLNMLMQSTCATNSRIM